MSIIIVFLQKAIAQGIAILYVANGEILTEKTGNLNLGVPGMMYMGGVAGLIGAFLYENSAANPSPIVGMLIALICALVCSGLGALLYSILTISLRANQNVTGLALTTFGMGFGNFFGGSLSKLAGGVGQISTKVTASAFRAKIPFLSNLPVVGELLFSYGFLTYFAIIATIILSWMIYRTRVGLNLRAVGENPGTADAAGINVPLYKYLSTWICIMLTVRMVLGPGIGTALYTNVLQERQQHYITRYAQNVDVLHPEASASYTQTVQGMLYQGKSLEEGQQMASMSVKGNIQKQAVLSSVKEISGWTLYACLICMIWIVVMPHPKRKLLTSQNQSS